MNVCASTLFKENEVGAALEICELFLELCRVLLTENPENGRLRKIGVNSDVFKEWFLCYEGTTDILYNIGYKEDETCFLLPGEFDRSQVVELQKSLEALKSLSIDKIKRQQLQQLQLSFTGLPVPTNGAESSWKAESVSLLKKVQQHENPELQRKALELLPLDELKDKVQNNYAPSNGPTNKACPKDLLVVELLSWFKGSFFRWVDIPPCPWCGATTTKAGSASPDPLHLLWGAHRVEAYYCSTCHVKVPFPRYNNPGQLLITRRGRCGEWANCFLLFLRALGYQARFVNDNKDHVWTEVYSQSQQRWLHCDPCECAFDKPLLYEKGWKKDLHHVWAYACDHVQDVSWRYTSNHKSVLKKRKDIGEEWLIALIQALTSQLQERLSPERKEELLQQRTCELVQFLTPPSSQSDGHQGRTSGSLSWRLERGETRQTGFVFTPLPQELVQGRMDIAYNPVLDKYQRLQVDGPERELRNWSKGCWEWDRVFRKEEHDWKKVYLCVEEGGSRGHLRWRFTLPEGHGVTEVQVQCRSTVFQNGRVLWMISDGRKTVDIQNGMLERTNTFRGARELTLHAQLICGQHWQHAQLFRSDTNPPPGDSPMHISIQFNKKI